MRALTRSRLGSTIAVLFFLTGAVGAAGDESSTYPIGAGDLLQIAIYAGGEEQESFTTVVSSTLKITTPLLGELSIDGLMTSEIAELLARRLAAGYYVNPQVIVNVKEYAGKVYVLGEVQRPGAYNVRDGLTALTACVLAGGFSDFAALNRVKVLRVVKGGTQVIKIDLGKVRKGKKPDLVLQPGDRVEVPHRRF